MGKDPESDYLRLIHELEVSNVELVMQNKELEQRVEEATAQLLSARKEVESFAYSISHDLRAPLRHICGFITLLKENHPTQYTMDELRYMDIISGGAQEMEKLIDALLSFSRLSRAEMLIDTINTSELVLSVIRFLKSDIRDRKIIFKVGQIHDGKGDEQLIKQVWINLISNAIKYTSQKPLAYIIIGSTKNDKETTYFVKDNGAGFDMKYADRLFGVFQRLHKSRDFEGVGIGLANVNSIIIRHNGHCRAEGEVDKGATFYFSLPN